MRMKKLTVQDINNYVGTTVNPLNSPDTIYELYSVPSFDSDYPEVLHGSEIGSSKVTIEENDVLVCKINPRINRVWIVKHHTKHQLIASSEWVIIRSPENNPRYLMYYFQSPTFRTYINSGLTGIGGSLTRAQPKQIAKYPVPLPSIELQDRIAATLDKLQSIITHRKQQLKKLDELVKARFVEMFGEVGTDPKDFGMKLLNDVCEINPKKTDEKRLHSGLEVSFVPMPAVSETGEIDATEIRTYDEVKTGFTYFAENDVLFAKITPCMENGKGAVAEGLCNEIGFGSTEFHVLRPIKEVSNPYWLYAITSFEMFRREAARKMTGSAGQRRVPARFLEQYRVAVPPIDLQQQFAAFVKQTDKSKFPAPLPL